MMDGFFKTWLSMDAHVWVLAILMAVGSFFFLLNVFGHPNMWEGRSMFKRASLVFGILLIAGSALMYPSLLARLYELRATEAARDPVIRTLTGVHLCLNRNGAVLRDGTTLKCSVAFD